jgi:hypothetical protein
MEPNQAIPVDNVGQEYAYIAATPCACGGSQHVTGQALVSYEGRYYDQLEVVCTRCGQRGVFLFDISAFFGAPEQEKP